MAVDFEDFFITFLYYILVRIPYKYESILNRDPWEMSHMLQKQGKVELIIGT